MVSALNICIMAPICALYSFDGRNQNGNSGIKRSGGNLGMGVVFDAGRKPKPLALKLG
jgi:hypothetical protein